jgi:hypothetical protein
MPDIRYVCLSDLHFGAENSVLTQLAPGSVECDPHTVSPVLEQLVSCLGELIGRNEEPRPKPRLILCGDILELALANDNVAAMVFEHFIELIFPEVGEPLFEDVIYFVPGNHDHHLWEAARERQYAEYVRLRPLNQDLEIPWHTTRMLTDKDPQPVDAELLTTLVRRNPRAQAASVRAIYPNLALLSPDGKRSVVFHHGHYLEAMYRLMTTLKNIAFPERPHPETIWDVEAENFAWVDFFWSTMGRSGAAGADVGLLYASFQSQVAMDRIADNISKGVARHLPGPLPVRWLESLVVHPALRNLARKVGEMERSQPQVPLTPPVQAELQAYLDGPLRLQFMAERGEMPEQLTFVFGHTHKPFETFVPNGDYGHVDVYNTGGWVVDTLRTAPLQGGAAILISEELETLALRFYNQSDNSSEYRVTLAHADPAGPAHSAFFLRLQGMIDFTKPPWSVFSAAAAAMVSERHHDLAKILDVRGELPK